MIHVKYAGRERTRVSTSKTLSKISKLETLGEQRQEILSYLRQREEFLGQYGIHAEDIVSYIRKPAYRAGGTNKIEYHTTIKTQTGRELHIPEDIHDSIGEPNSYKNKGTPESSAQ